MLLASYQPFVEDSELRVQSTAFEALVNALGFVPYFCFPAEKLEDMLVYSFFAAPNWPEKLIIFESNDYRKLDVVQWNRILKLEKEGKHFDVSIALAETTAPFCEYLVPALDNVRFEIGLHEALHTCFNIDYVDEDARNTAEGWLAFAQGTASKLVAEARFRADSPEREEALRLRLQKNAFEVYVLPVLYIFMVSGKWEDLGTMLNPDWIFKNSAPMKMLARLYNPEEPMDYKTYGVFQKAFGSFQANMHIGGKKPSKNGLCPCGSGKKFKRCCGR